MCDVVVRQTWANQKPIREDDVTNDGEKCWCVCRHATGGEPTGVGWKTPNTGHAHTHWCVYLSLTDCWPVCVAYASHAAVATWATPFVRFFFLA